MTFSEFAKRLYTVIGAGSSTSSFARTLLDTIVVYEDEALNPIQELKAPTFKAYYNGTNNITKTAKKINANIETSVFEEYIDSNSDNSVQALRNLFEEDIPDITPHNASQNLQNCLLRLFMRQQLLNHRRLARVNQMRKRPHPRTRC